MYLKQLSLFFFFNAHISISPGPRHEVVHLRGAVQTRVMVAGAVTMSGRRQSMVLRKGEFCSPLQRGAIWARG